MKLRRTLFAALVAGTLLPAVPASAAQVFVVTVSPRTASIDSRTLETGLFVDVSVRVASPNPLLNQTIDSLPALPSVPVEVVINGIKKTGNTSIPSATTPGDFSKFTAKFTLTDFATAGVPAGPTKIVATALAPAAPLDASGTKVASVGTGVVNFDTALPPSGLVEQIDSGASHTCVLTTSTGVRCWGSGTLGQIGNGASLDTTSASVVKTGTSPLLGIIAIDAGTNHTCALKNDGTVWCWGLGSRGQLGTGISGSSSNVAVKADLAKPAVSIAAGSEHTCAVTTDTRVYCWGREGATFLARSSLTVPVAATFDFATEARTDLLGAIEVVAGAQHSCARLADDTVTCWGDASFNRLGGAVSADPLLPRPVPSVSRATDLEAGRAHTCAATATGAICWGFNLNGQLGRGDTTTAPAPVALAGTPTAMALGTSHSCFAIAGVTSCTGRNVTGVFGNNSTTSSMSPVAVPQASGAFDLSAGDDHTCFVGPLVSAVTKCSGLGANGRLGHSALTNSLVPVNTQGLDFARSISAGEEHTCALLATPGRAKCWGENGSGQLGDGTTVDKAEPTLIAVRADAHTIASGDDHNCVLGGTPGDATGDPIQCWGENGSGQLGNSSFVDATTPVDLVGISATAITLGANHTCAIVPVGSSNSVKCWGSDASGQLGDDAALVNKSTPTTVAGLDGSQGQLIVSIDAGRNHTCAALADGSLRCWGSNAFGQLGQTGDLQLATPAVAPFIAGAVEVAAGDISTCIRDTATEIQCFGGNDHGQLGSPGDGSPFPVQKAADLSEVALVRGGGSHGCAVTLGDYILHCWGSNVSGQIGDGTTDDAPLKKEPLPLDLVIEAGLGTSHTCALLRDTTVKCWGANASGQVGNGSVSESVLEPTIIAL